MKCDLCFLFTTHILTNSLNTFKVDAFKYNNRDNLNTKEEISL